MVLAWIMWPIALLIHARDGADHAYGCKSSTLEAIALALPLLCCPQSSSWERAGSSHRQ
jgi:hypothetical protein